jgi:predicted DNA-binding antitoxin AbrB/MazE fold protein
MYTAIKGIYENGVLTLLEPVPSLEKSEVLVTFLNNGFDKPLAQKRVPGSLKRLGELEGKKYSIPNDFNEPLDDLKDYM